MRLFRFSLTNAQPFGFPSFRKNASEYLFVFIGSFIAFFFFVFSSLSCSIYSPSKLYTFFIDLLLRDKIDLAVNSRDLLSKNKLSSLWRMSLARVRLFSLTGSLTKVIDLSCVGDRSFSMDEVFSFVSKLVTVFFFPLL
jgi:hypothetical protein